MTDQLLQRGDVVAWSGKYFVVWNATVCNVEAFPIRLGARPGSRRFLIPVGDELAGWGIADRRAVVAASEREVLARGAPLDAIRVGRCSGGLICRIVGAAARAYAAEFVARRGRRECNNNSDAPAVLAAAE